jgi:hypothetical protein
MICDDYHIWFFMYGTRTRTVSQVTFEILTSIEKNYFLINANRDSTRGGH